MSESSKPPAALPALEFAKPEITPPPPPAAAILPAPVIGGGKLTTYEACLSLIENTSPTDAASTLSSLKEFFTFRIAKKKSDEATNPDGAVKRAMTMSRSFKPYATTTPSKMFGAPVTKETPSK